MENKAETKGKVYLVGSGPGDEGLLTRKGERLLRSADIVLYDRLVGEEIMEMIPEETEKINVGKDAGHHPIPQEETNRMLLEEALKGKQVVRLKGGDPFLFGRGGEELELLQQEGIAFEVVPGITSAIAAAAYGGIPVTHRDLCSSVHFITGHAQGGKELTIDYDALTRLDGTLVFLMGVATSGIIADGLLRAGMDPQMPSAVVENGTRSEQRTFVQPLSELKSSIEENKIQSPALLIVGRVCSLAAEFNWYDRLPLKGMRFLVTRPQAGQSRLAEGLRALGAGVDIRPAIRTVPIRPLKLPQRQYEAVVFTSAAGVESYCSWLLETGEDMRWFAGKKVACIGPATASALKDFGIKADFVPGIFSGKALGEEMIAQGFVGSSDRILLLRTDIPSRDVTDVLEKAGIAFDDVPVYRTLRLNTRNEEEKDRKYDVITFTSRSCVEGFAGSNEAADPDGNSRGESKSVTEDSGRELKKRYEGQRALCIGEKTAEAAREYGFDVVCSDEATIASMLQKAVELAEK